MKVYLDNNATTPLHPKVKEVLIKSLDLYGNPSSHHGWGRKSHHTIDQARENVASFFGATPKEIVFTASGSEANNMVIKGIFFNEDLVKKGDHLITTAIEHPSVLKTCQALENKGFQVTYLSVDQYGIISTDELKKSIRTNTKLITIIFGNNEIGSIQPIQEVAEICNKHNILFHTDAVQAIGKIDFDVNDLGVDFFSLSGHKICAPKGVGALYIRKGQKLVPLIEGGAHERGRRAGTENILGIIGLSETFNCLRDEMNKKISLIKRLRDKLEKEIFNKIPDVRLNGHPEKRLPGTLNVSFNNVEGEAILLMLDQKGIAVSTGSACHSDSVEPSHVITALGVDLETAHSSVRFSLGRENTDEEIDYVIQTLPKVIADLRKLSPKSS